MPDDASMLRSMSLLSQLAPGHPDRLVAIGIATSTSAPVPATPIGSEATERRAPGRLVATAELLARVLLSDGSADDEAIAQLEAAVDEHVDVWTPALHTTSRFELVSVLTNPDDALGDLRVAFSEEVEGASTVFFAWRASARFVRPAFLDDDQLLEPTGAVVRLAGAMSMAFTPARRAERIRCYYDRLALITQMMAPPATVPL